MDIPHAIKTVRVLVFYVYCMKHSLDTLQIKVIKELEWCNYHDAKRCDFISKVL